MSWQKFLALRGVDAVYEIVGGHDGKRAALFYADLKAAQVKLSEGALRNIGAAAVAVSFLVIGGKVLNGDTFTAVGLYTPGQSCRELAGDKRVLREVLEIAAAENAPVYIEGRRQPEVHVKDVHFIADDIAAEVSKLRIPALGDGRPDRESCGVLFIYFGPYGRPGS